MKYLLTILLFTCFNLHSFAGVDLRQGTFYISYTDLDFPGSKTDISRSYSSGNTNTGLFGYGWSSFIETKITALPDGTICLSWWGGGFGDYYEPAVIDRKGLYEMVNAIIKEQVKNKKLDNNPVAIAEKRSYYLVNNKQRAEKYIELQKNKIVPVYIPPAQQQKKWLLDVNQVIVWTGTSYKVKSWEDNYEFNTKGQLAVVNDRAYNMRIQYANDRLASITVNDSNTCRITTDAAGRVIQLAMTTAGGEKKATFQYDSLNNLLYSKDAGNNEYWFSYDLYHNLVRIGYTDSTSMEMIYDAASNRIIKVKETKGNYTTYQYPYFYTEEGKINYDHYATNVKQFDPSGKLLFTQYREFENRIKDDGSTYLHRILEQTDTSYHEVLYAPEVGNARYRKKNNREAWAAYDSKRRPSYLHINDSIYKVAYNVNDLPEYFIQTDSIHNSSTTYKYQYDETGRLVQVLKNTDTFTIAYRQEKNITLVQKGNGQLLSIEQRNDGSAVLTDKNWGSISLSKEEWKQLNDALKNPVVETGDAEQKMIARQEKNVISRKPGSIVFIKPENRLKGLVGQIKSFPKVVTEEEKRKNILWTLYEFNDVLKPKKIEHEWIWERM